MSRAAIFRYEVPVDDAVHEHWLSPGPVLAVGCRDRTVVEFWTVYDPDTAGNARRFLVVGTGHPLPRRWTYVGTAVAPGGALVWHLIEVVEP